MGNQGTNVLLVQAPLFAFDRRDGEHHCVRYPDHTMYSWPTAGLPSWENVRYAFDLLSPNLSLPLPWGLLAPKKIAAVPARKAGHVLDDVWGDMQMRISYHAEMPPVLRRFMMDMNQPLQWKERQNTMVSHPLSPPHCQVPTGFYSYQLRGRIDMDA